MKKRRSKTNDEAKSGKITSFTEVCWMRLSRAEGKAKWQENDITG